MTRTILVACLFAMACNSPKPNDTVENAVKTGTNTGDTNIATTPVALAGCYAWAVKGDTATMKLAVKGNNVTGNLAYNWREKDRNSGTIKGTISDNLVVVDYTFQSEGMTSVREVAFKIKGNSLVEGYGDYNTSGDTMRIKNKTRLMFQTDRAFERVECKE